MSTSNHNWAIVLAAGEGKRLRELTTRSGVPTPKQFCSLRGGRSLLGDALARAARIVPRKRVVVIVAEEHRSFFERDLVGVAPENVIVQPRNKGTAAGILLPALNILERDPEARIAFLPSDHYVSKEYVVESSLRLALESLEEEDGGLTLLGITPDSPETGYGWIVPAASDRLLRPVERFVEKPSPDVAAELFAGGALWNSFLFAVKGSTLLALYRERLPEILEAFHAAHGPRERRAADVSALYERIGTSDFSREVLQEHAHRLRLEIVPPCGWTDLGTPARVRACLDALRESASHEGVVAESRAAFDLALALDGLALTGEPAALTA